MGETQSLPQLAVNEEAVLKGNRPLLLHHDTHGLFPGLLHPGGDLPDVGHRGAEADEGDVRGGEDDGLLPHSAPLDVVDVVDLVQDDGRYFVQAGRILKQRIPDLETLDQEVQAWLSDRNSRFVKVDWRFSTADARIKLKRLYPKIHD